MKQFTSTSWITIARLCDSCSSYHLLTSNKSTKLILVMLTLKDDGTLYSCAKVCRWHHSFPWRLHRSENRKGYCQVVDYYESLTGTLKWLILDCEAVPHRYKDFSTVEICSLLWRFGILGMQVYLWLKSFSWWSLQNAWTISSSKFQHSCCSYPRTTHWMLPNVLLIFLGPAILQPYCGETLLQVWQSNAQLQMDHLYVLHH